MDNCSQKSAKIQTLLKGKKFTRINSLMSVLHQAIKLETHVIAGAPIMWQKGAQKTFHNFVAGEALTLSSMLFERIKGAPQ